MTGGTRIRPVRISDAAAVQRIYAPYVTETTISLEEDAPNVDAMAERISGHSPGHPYLVAESGADLIAYAYAAPYHRRSAYRLTSEVSIYVDRTKRGQGIGRHLFEALLRSLVKQGQHVALGVITLPNEVSVALHEAYGFRPVGVLSEVGWKFGVWRDVGLWQLRLSDLKENRPG